MLALAAPRPACAAAQLYRLQSGNAQLITTSQSERDQLISGGWTMMGTIGEACTTSSEESMLIPLYRLYRSAIGDHFYTANTDERTSALSSGYTDEGITAYVYQSDDTGREPLFRAFNPTLGQHLFTCDRTEYNALSSSWNREGIAAYVKTNAAPLFRENNPTGLSSNLITISKSENDSLVASGWNTSGVIAFAYAIGNEEPGLLPLYRLYNTAWNDHVFTTSQSEHDSWVSLGWQDQGIACYVFTQTGADHEPLYRAFNLSTHQHLFTTDPAEYNALSGSWNKEGIDCYVMYNPVPGGLTVVTLGSGRMGLYWQSVPNATGYNIYRSTTAGGENYATPVNATPVNTPSYPGSPWCMFADTGLTNGTQYYYTVEAVYPTGSSGPSDEDSDVPSSGGVPWDSANPATVLAAVRAYFQVLPNYSSFASAPFRVAGPDGRIYADGQSSVLLPDGVDIPGSGQVQFADGSRATMPQTSEQTVTIQNAQPQSLEPENGPYRRVLTLGAQYWGVSGRFDLPAAGNVNRPTQSDGIFLYVGSASAVGVKHPAQIDAGLIWSQPGQGLQGWKSYMFITRPYPQNPNQTIHMKFPVKDDGLLIQPGHFADLTFEVHNQTVAKGMCVLTIEADGDPSQMRVLVAISGYAGGEAVRVKRLIAVAQPAVGYVKTGSYLLGAGWEYGQVLPAHAGPTWQDWLSAYDPSESGSFPADARIVFWKPQIDYKYETDIGIDLRP